MRHTTSFISWPCVAAVVVVATVGAGGRDPSSDQTTAAISDDARPYTLHPYTLHDSPASYESGVVYTPRVFKSLAARLPAGVKPPTWTHSADFVVALRWFPPSDAFTRTILARSRPKPDVRIVRAQMAPLSTAAIRPHWIAGPEALEVFGPLPYPDIVAVAAFPADAFKAGFDIIVYYTEVNGGNHVARAARITEADVATWR